MQGSGSSWLFPLTNGAPPIGWHDAAAYLVLPVLLIVSQYASQKIISPPSTDPQQQQTQNILRFLPLMIGAPRAPAARACSSAWRSSSAALHACLLPVQCEPWASRVHAYGPGHLLLAGAGLCCIVTGYVSGGWCHTAQPCINVVVCPGQSMRS